MKAIENNTAEIDRLKKAIDAITFPAVADIRNITAQINSTAISKAKVDQIYAQAADGLKKAKEALNVTQSAE